VRSDVHHTAFTYCFEASAPNDRNFQPVRFGNEVALNVGKGGCGTGRNLYSQAGSQGTHGQPASGNPRPQGCDILSQFGPDTLK
jgi:hypothetical protein